MIWVIIPYMKGLTFFNIIYKIEIENKRRPKSMTQILICFNEIWRWYIYEIILDSTVKKFLKEDFLNNNSCSG